jgi:hypothetical protein
MNLLFVIHDIDHSSSFWWATQNTQLNYSCRLSPTAN